MRAKLKTRKTNEWANEQSEAGAAAASRRAGREGGSLAEESVGGVVRKLITDAQWQLADGEGAAPQATLKFEQMAQQGAQCWRVAGGASWLAEVAKSLPVV